jgi:hypothetical protein
MVGCHHRYRERAVVTFAVRFPTRHTDTFAATGFVHAGVLLALTELAYSAYEQAAGLEKGAHIVAVERRTRAEYFQPLPWRGGAMGWWWR